MLRTCCLAALLGTLPAVTHAAGTGDYDTLQQNDTRRISGRVTDDTGKPLMGVTVVEKGTTNGVSTTADGSYTLRLQNAENAVLEFSFIGYRNTELPAGTKTTLDVQLTESVTTMDNVVVIGYGTTTKKELTGSVSSLKSDDFKQGNITNPLQLLQGQVAGLNIVRADGGDPNGDFEIQLRGMTTMAGGASPLVVIDGVPQPDAGRMNDLNPNDIESINILKDAGSAAIYGARSSNGVILITTKNGRKEMAPQIRFSAKVGIENPDILYKAVPTYRNAILRNEALSNVGREPLFTAAEIQDFYNHGDCEAAVEQAMQNALQQNYNVSVTGGTKTTTYMLSASYFDQESNYVGPDYGVKRYNLRSNLTTEFGRLKLGAKRRFHPFGDQFPVGCQRRLPLRRPHPFPELLLQPPRGERNLLRQQL